VPALGWEITPHVTLEGRGIWLDGDRRADAFAALLGARVPLQATTFALAVDLVLADGRLGSRESTFIDQLRAALRLDGEAARTILDVLLVKNRASGRPDR
jgi:hypothetical protein